MVKYFIVSIFYCFSLSVSAQDLRCNLTLNFQAIPSPNLSLFGRMKDGLTDFINNRTWGSQSLPNNERVLCDFTLNILEQSSQNSFRASLLIVAQRPVYNSNYQSPTFNFFDNALSFTFSENEKIEFTEGTFGNALTASIAYWIYIILGIDGDSFSPNGGTEYFTKSERIVSSAASVGTSTWQSSDRSNKSKFWLVNNYNNAQYGKLRTAIYKYHRLGLDMLYDNPEEARKNIIDALQDLQSLYNDKPDNLMLAFYAFFDAKADEIVNIFSGATPTEKGEVYRIVNKINNANERKYRKLNE